MDMDIPETLHVDVFEMRFADIHTVEMSQLQALSIGVGWPHRGADWQHALEVGHGYVALDEIGRVTASSMWFPYGDDFATFGMMITSPRLQANGTAKWLVDRILADCSGRRLRLNSTRQAKRLYKSIGFRQTQIVYQCQGEVGSVPPANPVGAGRELRRLEQGDIEAVIALDAPAFGARRADALLRLFERSTCYGLFEGDRLIAYAMRRRFGRGHVVGPVVAFCDEDAMTVIHPHVVANAGRFLRLDTHLERGAFANFVQQSGMPIYDTVTTMVTTDTAGYGAADIGRPVVYALASQSFG